MWATFGLLLVAVACVRFGDASLELQSLPDEAAALLRLETASAVFADAQELAWLSKRGWFEAARKLVMKGHELGKDGLEQQQAFAKVVRQEAQDLKQKCDALTDSLTVQKEIGKVSCAFQWAQNSSCIFLSVKFAHRWSSPGALELHNTKVNLSDCCFNFSADAQHSGLKKRYILDLSFFAEVDPQHLTWQLASAGRLTAMVPKKLPGQWPSLLRGKEKRGNMQTWSEMYDRWSAELKVFKKLEKHFSDSEHVSTFELDKSDFKTLDMDSDGKASKYEVSEFAKIVTAVLFTEKDTFPYVKMWDTDKNGRVNDTEWQGFPSIQGSMLDSKLGVTRLIMLAQHKKADKDRDGFVTYEDLRTVGFASNDTA